MRDDSPTGTFGRLLAVLSALQSGGVCTGPDLAGRLGVTVRTIRRDIERLRDLGYPIDADLGVAGGYRLGFAGSRLPPLMLDDHEAVALAVCVRSSAADSAAGVAEAAVRALDKLERMLPSRLRPQLEALSSGMVRLPSAEPVPATELLVALGRACREHDELAVSYVDARGIKSGRRLEPLRLVSAGRRWYLVARDRRVSRRSEAEAASSEGETSNLLASRARVDVAGDRRDGDWRTFRVDRIVSATPTGHRFRLVDPPDPVSFVQRSITTAPYRYQARIEFQRPLAEMSARVPVTVGVLEAVDDHTTLLTTGADDLDLLVLHIGLLDTPFQVLEPAALAVRVAEVADNLGRSAR